MDAIKTTAFTLISDIRYFLYAGFQNLPLSIAGIMISIGLLTANYGMLFFSVGYLVIFPAILYAFNLIPLTELYANASACDLIPSAEFGMERQRSEPTQGIGYWIPMTFFFIGYIMTNAYFMYSTPVATSDTPENDSQGNPINTSTGFANRQSNTITAMAVISLLAIVCIAVRLMMPCEGIVAMIIGVLGGGFSGVGWYYFLKGIADHRISDLFGMANRLLGQHALSNQPYVCLPTGA